MAFCSQCGSQLPDESAKFCVKCGTQQPAQTGAAAAPPVSFAPPVQPAKKKKKGLRVALAILLPLLVLAAAAVPTALYLTGPDRVAEKYVKAYAAGDWEQVYKLLSTYIHDEERLANFDLLTQSADPLALFGAKVRRSGGDGQIKTYVITDPNGTVLREIKVTSSDRVIDETFLVTDFTFYFSHDISDGLYCDYRIGRDHLIIAPPLNWDHIPQPETIAGINQQYISAGYGAHQFSQYTNDYLPIGKYHLYILNTKTDHVTDIGTVNITNGGEYILD
ncbi:MAG: zinc-ribbon domain-containing protein [Oscillospiraceae bacterium]|jgi:hypothetical protein|nr:zinc-ribbon domain-containing protein [Oscillospiraceae bacterium]